MDLEIYPQSLVLTIEIKYWDWFQQFLGSDWREPLRLGSDCLEDQLSGSDWLRRIEELDSDWTKLMLSQDSDWLGETEPDLNRNR